MNLALVFLNILWLLKYHHNDGGGDGDGGDGAGDGDGGDGDGGNGGDGGGDGGGDFDDDGGSLGGGFLLFLTTFRMWVNVSAANRGKLEQVGKYSAT